MTTANRHQVQPQLQQPVYDRAELHNQQPAVITPLAQALITGTLAAIFFGMAAWLFDARPLTILKVAGITGVTTTMIAWAGLTFRWLKVTSLEYFFGQDLNGDNHVGELPPIKYTVNTFNQEGTMTGQRMYTFTGVTPEQIEAFCHKTRKLAFPISRRKWVDAGIFTDDGWRAFYSELIQSQLVAMIKGKNVLTEEGKQWADGIIAETDPSYSPSEDSVE